MIRAILACDDNFGIGKNGILPWPHNTKDLAWFRKCTEGDLVVMGRKTWESLPGPLPHRLNFVITSSSSIRVGYHGRYGAGNIPAVLKSVIEDRHIPKKDVWVIGGAQLFNGAVPVIEEIWLSRIKGVFNCDVFLPEDTIKNLYEIYHTEVQDNLYIEKWKRK